MQQYIVQSGGGGGVSYHGALTGLDEDHHLHYLTADRGGALFSALGHNHDGVYSPVGHDHTGVYSAVGHAHDDRYYTETEVTTLLGGFAVTGHNHDGVYATSAHNHSGVYAVVAHNHDGVYSVSGHTHDDRYYTESEINSTLSGYAVTGHNHDGVYSAISHNHSGVYATASHNHDSAYAAAVHTHDDRYFTETEITTTLSGYSLTSHNHTGVYATSGHTHDYSGTYAALSHTHDDRYYTETEINSTLTGYSLASHNHSGVYATASHNHDASYAAVSHTHDDRYYTETEIDTILTGYTTTSHNHDHGGLVGNADDDHTQYALLAGRSGGQVVYGGTDANDDLTLSSTSSATKGDVYIAADGGRVGIGTNSIDNFMEVEMAGDVFISNNGSLYFNKKSDGTAALVFGVSGVITDAGILQSPGGGFGFRDSVGAFKMFMDNTGKFGINTTSPSKLLEVNGDALLTGNSDLYLRGSGIGLSGKFHKNASGITSHFIDTTAPSGFSWAGSPFATPTTVTLGHSSDFMRLIQSSSTPTRHFYYKDVSNSAAAWQNKFIQGRVGGGAACEVGFRFDDGTDTDYAEIFFDSSAANGTCTVKFRYRVNNGTVTTATMGANLPGNFMYEIRLYMYWNGSAYYGYGYLLQEDGLTTNLSGFATPSFGAAFPVAGRVGIYYGNTALANPGLVDWVYTTF